MVSELSRRLHSAMTSKNVEVVTNNRLVSHRAGVVAGTSNIMERDAPKG
jgi:hypothetical protein